MTAPVVLTPYPLLRRDREAVERALSVTPVYRNLTELRRLPPLQMIKALRTEGTEHCVIAVPDRAAQTLRPMLHVIAAASGFRRVDAIGPNGRERLPRWRAPLAAAAILRASASGTIAVRMARREVDDLLAQERLEAPLRGTGRVVYLNANLWFGDVGGSVGHTAGVVNALARAGQLVEVASLSPPPSLLDDVGLIALRAASVLGTPFENNSYRYSRDVTRQLRRVLSTGGVRFVYQRLSVGNYSGVVLCRETRTPLALEYNGSEAWSAKHWGRPLRRHDLAVAAEQACFKHASLVVTVSDVLRDELLERGVPASRIVWYPNCIDPQIFDPDRYPEDARSRLRAELGIPSDSVVVTFIGTFGQWHGVEVLARAIVQLASERSDWLKRHQVQFLLVGDGSKSPEVQQILDSGRGCVPFVVRTGLVPQPQAPAYLATSDVLVSPHIPNPDGSRFFGSPTKLFEYMAMGKAIIASNLDQIGEVLEPSLPAGIPPVIDPGDDQRELAVLAQPGSVTELIAGIELLVEHPRWRDVLGANVRARALQRYTWRHHVAAILSGIESVSPTGL